MHEATLQGLNLGFIIQTALLVSATVVAGFWGNAFLRKKATIDYILNLQRDNRLRSAKNHLLNADHQALADHARCRDADDSLRDDLFYLLNCYEYFAVGINEKCFHERLARRLNRSLILTIWDRYQPLISGLRSEMELPALYCELELLVKRWR